MGFIAITGNDGIAVETVSDCLVLGGRKSYVFVEIQFNIPESPAAKDYTVSVYVSGKIGRLKDGKSITDSRFFSEWYYSQKALVRKPGGILEINGTDMQVTHPVLQDHFNRDNNVTTIQLSIANCLPQGCKRLVCFFTYETSQNLSRTFGTVTLQSRYYDRKECPFGQFFENTVMRGDLITPNHIYCWFIARPGYYLAGYTSFGELQPRDIRIIEPTYLSLLNNRRRLSRIMLAIKCRLLGFPQVINWKFTENQITFQSSLECVGKWDEIRLFATFKGFELSSAFVAISCLASIVGLIFYFIDKLK